MSVGERIKSARKEKGLTQKQLADMIGAAVITVRQYENNKRQPSLVTISAIAAALGKSLIELLEEESPPYDPHGTDPPDKRYPGPNPADQLSILNSSADHAEDDKVVGVFTSIFDEYLNTWGKRKVMEYMEDLIAQPRYLQDGVKPVVGVTRG